jgi:hypothetical protein
VAFAHTGGCGHGHRSEGTGRSAGDQIDADRVAEGRRRELEGRGSEVDAEGLARAASRRPG